MGMQLTAAQLPPDVGEMLKACSGRFEDHINLPVTRFEVEVGEGNEILFVWLHAKVRGTSLGVFDPPSAPAR